MSVSVGDDRRIGEILAEALRAADPGAFLVSPRILRRVLREAARGPLPGFSSRHRGCETVSLANLRALISPEELGLADASQFPEHAKLIERPDALIEEGGTTPQILLATWRRLFHASVHEALDRAVDDGRLDGPAITERLSVLGEDALAEIRDVLIREDWLHADEPDRVVYIEFAAVYLELRKFAAAEIPSFFPAIEDYEGVEAMLRADVDADALFESTRLAGAAEAEGEPPLPVDPELPPDVPPQPILMEVYSGPRYRRLMLRAQKADLSGNDARAAIFRMRAARYAGPRHDRKAVDNARRAIDELHTRLLAALGLEDENGVEERAALGELLEKATWGFWNDESRLLYDLQAICVDHEKRIFAIDVMPSWTHRRSFAEWLAHPRLGPLVRPLPFQAEVLAVRNLNRATKRLTRVRISPGAKNDLSLLIARSKRNALEGLREETRPRIASSLRENGFQSDDPARLAAFERLTDELADQVAERGFLTLGDLRDAISRSQLKLPDLAGPGDLVWGDRLLRTDASLAIELDGVYRRGEIYLRALQRFTAVLFGTRTGRLLVKFLLLPYGAAFIGLEGLQHLLDLILELFHGPHLHLVNNVSLTVVGSILLGIINLPRFRAFVLERLRELGRGIKFVLIDLPILLFGLTGLNRFLRSRSFDLLWRAVLAPATTAVLSWIVFADWFGAESTFRYGAIGVYVLIAAGLTTRAGRDIEEISTDALAWTWNRIRHAIPGLFRLILQFFDGLLEGLDRLLYAVDEKLRFRDGQRPLTLAIKTVLGLVWFWITYLVRFIVNLFVEPQFNPIKHFPVVTVSHKVILPTVFPLARALEGMLAPAEAKMTAGVIVTSIPGIFGFLAWELKENWRLYLANRADLLKPLLVGHHGETIGRFLRRGFHSGTVPKLFDKLRKAWSRGNAAKVRKVREGLHHVEHSIHEFVERNILSLLRESPAFKTSPDGAPPELSEIHLATNRILLEFAREGKGHDEPPLIVTLEDRAGWLVGGVAQEGWLADRPASERNAIATALAGLYAMAGVDVIRQQVEAVFGPNTPYEVRSEGLVVREPGKPAPVVHALRGRKCGPIPFGRPEVAWTRWVEVWQSDRSGKPHPASLVEGMTFLKPKN